jgi:hypothetical protein
MILACFPFQTLKAFGVDLYAELRSHPEAIDYGLQWNPQPAGLRNRSLVTLTQTDIPKQKNLQCVDRIDRCRSISFS